MISEMWYDTFSRAYVAEKDYSAPEYRYVKVFSSRAGRLATCIERWDGEKEDGTPGYGMGIAYHEDEWEDPVMHSWKFIDMCQRHHFNPTVLRYIDIPATKFTELVKKFNVEEPNAKSRFIEQIPFSDIAP